MLDRYFAKPITSFGELIWKIIIIIVSMVLTILDTPSTNLKKLFS